MYLIARASHSIKKHSIIEAKEYFDKCISLHPHCARGHYHSHTIYRIMGELEQSKKALQTSIVESPELFQAYRELARIEKRHGNLEQAIVLLKKSSELNPYHPSMLCDLGFLHTMNKNT